MRRLQIARAPEAEPGAVSAMDTIAREVVELVAAEESLMFEELRAAYRRSSGRSSFRGRLRWDESLGSGVPGAVVLVTPVVLIVVDKVFDHLADDVADGIADRGTGAMHRLLRRRRKTDGVADAKQLPTFTDTQLDEVRRLASTTARDAGLSPTKAGLLADALARRLADRG